MRLYRVFAHRDGAAYGEPGDAHYVHPRQGNGRWDNPDDYLLVYAAATPEGAIGESFGRIPAWSDDMFEVPYLSGARSALATFKLSDEHQTIDLDDARTLVERDLHPTQVVIRDLSFTRPLARRLFHERDDAGGRRWSGIRWWSFWAPQWPVYAIWIPSGTRHPLQLVEIEGLTVGHPAVREAAATIVRTIA